MSRERDRSHPTDAFGLPEGLLAAIVCALLLIVVFAVVSAATPMPPAEYWAALTTFTLLALGATLPGCAALYDALGRAVRRDWRALAALVALIPALYAAYALAVRELNLAGLGAAIAFAAVPALAFGAARSSRTPAVLDFVALAYLGVSLLFNLLPALTLPQQGGLVGFFQLAVVPLLLLLFAWRGWPGLGFTWHLGWREFAPAVIAGILGVIAVSVISATLDDSGFGPTTNLFVGVVTLYFFVALPLEVGLRGGVQNGLARLLRGRFGELRADGVAVTVVTVLIAVGFFALSDGRPPFMLYALPLGAAPGWAYMRTGKVTASALTTTIALLPLLLLP